jgi:hypothetical protein
MGPPPTLSKKQKDQILWAFRQNDDYNRLRGLLGEGDYCEAASRGLLRMAAIKALTNAGFREEDVKVYSWG